MKLSAILEALRARLDDTIKPYQWSDAQLKSWIDEGHMEACRRTRYLSDTTLRVSIVSGTASYAYPDGVIFPLRAKLTGEDRPLRFTSYKTLDDQQVDWESDTGTPTDMVCDLGYDKFRLYPTPDANGTLTMVGIIEPAPLTNETEIPSRFGYGIVDWGCYRAYQVDDVDTTNLNKSLAYLKDFEAEFGPKSTAKDEVFNFRNLPFNNYDGFF